MARGTTLGVAVGAWLALAGAAAAGPVAYRVTVDTSALSGTSGYLDFQFNKAVLAADDATAVVSHFTTDGQTGAVDPTFTFNVTGSLPGNVTLVATVPPPGTELAQAFNYGTSLGFDLVLSGPALDSPSGGDPFVQNVIFLLNLLDSQGNALLAGGGPVLTITINPDGTVSALTSPNGSGPPVVSLEAIPVPEPSALLLMGLAGALAAAGRRRAGRG